jgi:hypothetical protein
MQRGNGRTRGSALRVPGARERAGARDASRRGTGADRGAARVRDTGRAARARVSPGQGLAAGRGEGGSPGRARGWLAGARDGEGAAGPGPAGEEEGEVKEREREREGRGKLTSGDPNSGDHDSKP